MLVQRVKLFVEVDATLTVYSDCDVYLDTQKCFVKRQWKKLKVY